MVGVAQLVRASGCGSEGRGFDSHHSPHKESSSLLGLFFISAYRLYAVAKLTTPYRYLLKIE